MHSKFQTKLHVPNSFVVQEPCSTHVLPLLLFQLLHIETQHARFALSFSGCMPSSTCFDSAVRTTEHLQHSWRGLCLQDGFGPPSRLLACCIEQLWPMIAGIASSHMPCRHVTICGMTYVYHAAVQSMQNQQHKQWCHASVRRSGKLLQHLLRTQPTPTRYLNTALNEPSGPQLTDPELYRPPLLPAALPGQAAIVATVAAAAPCLCCCYCCC
jgi:hypothetical protein